MGSEQRLQAYFCTFRQQPVGQKLVTKGCFFKEKGSGGDSEKSGLLIASKSSVHLVHCIVWFPSSGTLGQDNNPLSLSYTFNFRRN